MGTSADFYKSILDSVTEHIVIIDGPGSIRFVNGPWVDFACENDCETRESSEWQGISYLGICDSAARVGDVHGRAVAAGIREVVGAGTGVFYYEYPCHSSTEERWFMMRVMPLQWEGEALYIISHQNITERKQAEERVRELSLTDGLTGLANRRHLDEFLRLEWRRAVRMSTPLSLVLLDIDHFKPYNDRYGHPAGDRCLQEVSRVLETFGKRPSDLVARYGGEEFALVLGETSSDAAATIAHELHEALRTNMRVDSGSGPEATPVTVSLGVAAVQPPRDQALEILVERADAALYEAKDSGRNQVVVSGRVPA